MLHTPVLSPSSFIILYFPITRRWSQDWAVSPITLQMLVRGWKLMLLISHYLWHVHMSNLIISYFIITMTCTNLCNVLSCLSDSNVSFPTVIILPLFPQIYCTIDLPLPCFPWSFPLIKSFSLSIRSITPRFGWLYQKPSARGAVAQYTHLVKGDCWPTARRKKSVWCSAGFSASILGEQQEFSFYVQEFLGANVSYAEQLLIFSLLMHMMVKRNFHVAALNFSSDDMAIFLI